MSILVTGGAGFIGSNFVIDWLSEINETVANLDLLTYADSLSNLASLQNNSLHMFVRDDIGDSALVSELLQEHRPRAVVNFAAESHVDRSIHGPEEIAFRQKWISRSQLEVLSLHMLKNGYGKYLMQVVRELVREGQ